MTALDVQACRVALAAAAATTVLTISGQTYVLDTADFINAGFKTPYFYVAEWTTIYDTSMGRGLDDHTVLCRLLAAPVANARVGSAILAGYMKPDGASSLRANLSASRTLGGLAQEMRVIACEGYATYTVGQDLYIGAQWRLEVR